jgi:HTH-type transcriptional regulator/antitoxin HigA
MIKSEKEYNAIVARVDELLSASENIDYPEAKGYP